MGKLFELDLEVFRTIHQALFGTPVGKVLYVVQLAGQAQGMLVLLALATLLAPRGRRFRVALQVTLSVLVAAGVCEVVKHVVLAPRPATLLPDAMVPGYWLDRSDKGRHGYSFPSGHTTATFAFAMAVAVVGGSRPAVAGAFLVAALTGLGRITLGAHFPADVLAGALLGSIAAWLLRRPLDRVATTVEARLGARFPGAFGTTTPAPDAVSPPVSAPAP